MIQMAASGDNQMDGVEVYREESDALNATTGEESLNDTIRLGPLS